MAWPDVRHRAAGAFSCKAAFAAIFVLALPLIAPGCAPSRPADAAWDPDSIPDAFARSTAALMWPGLPLAFLVDEHGALANGLWRVAFEPAADGARAGDPARVACQDRWLPVVRWNRAAGDVRWRFEAVAFPARDERDSVLAVSIRVEAVNGGTRRHALVLRAAFDSLEAAAPFVAPEGEIQLPSSWRWARAAGRDSACGWSAHALPGREAAGEFALEPGAHEVERFVVTSHALSAADLARCARESHAACVRRVTEYWRREVGRGTQFALGDLETERALAAARVVLLACRTEWAGTWYPIGGPFQYRDVWLRDGARLIQALAITGYTSEARRLADGLATLQWPQGAFLTQRGQLDGTGQALWAFEQASLRPRPDSTVGRLARQALEAWHWIEIQRGLSHRGGGRFAGFLPVTDPRDAELVSAQLVGNDAWGIAAGEAAARLAGAAGLRADSARVDSSRRAYRAEFVAALGRSDSPDVPPSWQGGGRDWGNLAVVWPTRALPASEPRCERLARRMWAEAGGAGLTCYGDRDSLQGYVGVDLAVWALLADRPAQADSVLGALLEWRTASGTSAELFSRSTRDFGADLPPHPTSAAALTALVRNALIYDDGDTLQLTLGARQLWWRGTRVTRAPTRWGTIDLEFRADARRASWTWTPVPVWTALRVPPGTRLAGRMAGAGAAAAHVALRPPGSGSFEAEIEGEP